MTKDEVIKILRDNLAEKYYLDMNVGNVILNPMEDFVHAAALLEKLRSDSDVLSYAFGIDKRDNSSRYFCNIKFVFNSRDDIIFWSDSLSVAISMALMLYLGYTMGR